MHRTVPGLFVTGNDTGVGKSYVAALIAAALVEAGHRVGVYKPAASGCREEQGVLVSDDAVQLWNAAGQPGDLESVCPQRFAAPLAPHLAAEAEGKRIDPVLLRQGFEYWRGRSDIVVVEGAGGLMSPLTPEEYVADLAADLRLPLVVVARNQIGVINQTLQTLIVAMSYGEGLDIAGVVLNRVAPVTDDPSLGTNRQELESRCVPPVLAEVDYQGGFETPIDWFQLAGQRR